MLFPIVVQGSHIRSDYNTGQTIYLVSFLAAELPGGLLSKKVGPDRLTPAVITLWGMTCACQAAMTGKTSFYILRALVGFLQGGFIPEMVLYLSYFYKSDELPVRLSVFWTAIPLTQIYGSLLAGGFLKMRGLRGWSGWQWLFLLEGLICVIIGLVSFGMMPASVTEPARFFRRKDGSNKWWTAEEEKILVNRVLRDDPTKGDMNNRQGVTLRGIWEALTNVDLWPVYLLGITAYIPFQPTANYLSLILRNMGYSVLQANLLAIPGYCLFTANVSLLLPAPAAVAFIILTLPRFCWLGGCRRSLMSDPSLQHTATSGCFHSSLPSVCFHLPQILGSAMQCSLASTGSRTHTRSWLG